jgi:hypothetical protein
MAIARTVMVSMLGHPIGLPQQTSVMHLGVYIPLMLSKKELRLTL